MQIAELLKFCSIPVTNNDKFVFTEYCLKVKQHMFISVLNYFAKENSLVFMIPKQKEERSLETF